MKTTVSDDMQDEGFIILPQGQLLLNEDQLCMYVYLLVQYSCLTPPRRNRVRTGGVTRRETKE